MLIPITHERNTSRRLPIVTISIIAVCLLVLSWSEWVSRGIMVQLNTELYHAVQMYKHSGRKIEAPQVIQQIAANGYVRDSSKLRTLGDGLPKDRSDIVDPRLRASQQDFDKLMQQIPKTLASAPVMRFGFIPANHAWYQYITHMFMHGGWFHLLFNAWFLWLVGCNIEDRWGRPLYAAFYFVSGLVAVFTYQWFFATSQIPLVGASGAIAGTMGAFAVVLGNTRIRFMFWFVKAFFFHARAYLALALWFLLNTLDAVMAGPHNRVAYWAHVGGFAFGAVVAGIMRVSGLDKRLDESIEYDGGTKQDPRLEEAGNLLTAHKMAEGLSLLEQLAKDEPDNVDVALEQLRGAKLLFDEARQVHAYERIISLHLRQGHSDLATEALADMGRAHLDDKLPKNAKLQIAKRLAGARQHEQASQLFASVVRQDGVGDAIAVEALIGQARAEAALGHRKRALQLLDEAKQSPFSTLQLDQIITNLTSRLSQHPSP